MGRFLALLVAAVALPASAVLVADRGRRAPPVAPVAGVATDLGADASRAPIKLRVSALPATIVGRCVDDRGRPVTGAVMKLSGWPNNSTRLRRHLIDHGAFEWSDPEPPSKVRLRTRRRPIADPHTYSIWAHAFPERAAATGSAAPWVEIGEVELVAGPAEEWSIHLPPEWLELPK